MNNLKQLIQEINILSFWGRIFGWKRIKQLLLQASLDTETITIANAQYKEHLEQSARELNQVHTNLQAAEKRINDLQTDKLLQASEIQTLRHQFTSAETKLAELNKNEQVRRTEHQESMKTLSELKDRTDEERAKMKEDAHQMEIRRLVKLKETWSVHQEETRNKIKSLCQKYTVEYVDKVPFKGEPDNTMMICGEYVVFDAKSPGGDDLKNFPTYLKKEAEAAVKYADKENVRSDIFFVVPSNTLEVLSHTYFVFPKHRVFVIASEGMEPVLLSLKKIEEYEFAEQMSPEERENLCRVIGRLMHHTKRRLQVDHYFSKEALALAEDCNNLLPENIADEVERIERAIYLNPPQERAGKEITLSSLIKDSKKIEKGLQDIDEKSDKP